MSYQHPKRWHEIQREEREREAHEAERERKFWHNVLVVKATVMATFVLYLVVPSEWKDYVALSGNLLWLWKT